MGHGFAEPVEIARRDGQGRRQVDDVAEGTNPDPLLHEARLEGREIGCARELHDSDGAENADVAQVLNERLGVWQVIADRVGDDTIEVGEALVGAIVIRSLRGGTLDEKFADRLLDAIAL